MQKHNSQFDRPRVETVLGMDGRAGAAVLLGTNLQRRRQAIISIVDSNRQVSGDALPTAGSGMGRRATAARLRAKIARGRAGGSQSCTIIYVIRKKIHVARINKNLSILFLDRLVTSSIRSEPRRESIQSLCSGSELVRVRSEMGMCCLHSEMGMCWTTHQSSCLLVCFQSNLRASSSFVWVNRSSVV